MRFALLSIILLGPPVVAGELYPGFRRSAHFDEQVREEWHDGCRIMLNLPGNFDPKRPTHLVIYATPNGNTIEQTLGCKPTEGLDWHFDIQHVAAQVRLFRALVPQENVVLAVVEAQGLSWPAYRAKFKDNPARIRGLVEGIMARIPAQGIRVTLTGHSGGGSFTSGFLNSHDVLPDWIERIAYLDSNYSYSDDDKHGDKLLAWLHARDTNRLIVIAYDDREITLNGKKVVGPTGGTWRATQRMIDRFAKNLSVQTLQEGDLEIHSTLNDRVRIYRHLNPQNKILHTALVGEMNGLLEALGHGRGLAWGKFGGPRAYSQYVQPAPVIPKRLASAPDGSTFVASLKASDKADRESQIARELLRGNMPEFERRFVTVTVRRKDQSGKEHSVAYEVMPDYLAIGSDTDFIRMPMTPQTATRLAEAWGCVLPTTAMVDQIHAAATVRLEPKPLGEPRESLEQFVNHHRIIEEQRQGNTPGALVSGIKKDIVWSNRIREKPKRLALYGWHHIDGTPIQPLTIVHHQNYVDYSHGVRFVKRAILLDGQPRDIRDILRNENLAVLLSDEGVLKSPGYE